MGTRSFKPERKTCPFKIRPPTVPVNGRCIEGKNLQRERKTFLRPGNPGGGGGASAPQNLPPYSRFNKTTLTSLTLVPVPPVITSPSTFCKA